MNLQLWLEKKASYLVEEVGYMNTGVKTTGIVLK